MSSTQIMVVLIVLIAVAGKVLSNRYRALGRHQQQAVPSADAARARDEVRQLKERIAVLERVITDNHGSIGLDREIERLRDR
jgi:hypothetical protein